MGKEGSCDAYFNNFSQHRINCICCSPCTSYLFSFILYIYLFWALLLFSRQATLIIYSTGVDLSSDIISQHTERNRTEKRTDNFCFWFCLQFVVGLMRWSFMHTQIVHVAGARSYFPLTFTQSPICLFLFCVDHSTCTFFIISGCDQISILFVI